MTGKLWGGAVRNSKIIAMLAFRVVFCVFSDKLGIWMFTLNSWFLNAGNKKKQKNGPKRTYLCTTLIHPSKVSTIRFYKFRFLHFVKQKYDGIIRNDAVAC